MLKSESRTARRPAALAVGLLLVMLGQAWVPAAAAADRVALVVGNSAYAHAGRLPNPVNDAADVGAALRRLGFEVTTRRDTGRAALADALADFTDRSAGADVALVFYAGHGMEIDGVNYLVPVDARLARDTRVRFETVTLDDVLAATEGAGLRVVILDACRNNPLARSMQRTVRTRSVSRGSFGDLEETLLGDETLVAYSAAAGTVADDGEGRNSPYTAALLKYLEQPFEILTLFRRVRGEVLTATGRRQRPHEYQSLLNEHYLSAPPVAASAAPAVADAPASVTAMNDGEQRLPAPAPAAAPTATAAVVVAPAGVTAVNDGERRLSALLDRDLSAFYRDENGWSDMHYAALFNLPEAVSALVDRGADVDAGLSRDGARFGVRLRRMLAARGLGDFDEWSRDGETPLHLAAWIDARAAVERLLESGADVNARTPYGWTPLHYAASSDARAAFDALVAGGADTEARDVNGDTALDLLRRH